MKRHGRSMLADLSVSPLPDAGVRALYAYANQRRDTNVLVTLAVRRDVPGDVTGRLAADSDWRVARAALRHITDTGVLDVAATQGVKRLEAVVANRACPRDVLVRACRDTDGDVQLWAWGNPSTPRGARRRSMTKAAVSGVLARGKNNADRAARAWVLASENPWLAGQDWAWELTPLARALACAPVVSDEVCSGRGGPIGRSARRGQLRDGQDVLAGGVLDTDALAAKRSALADLAVAGDERLDLAGALAVWSATRHIEPHVLATIAERFGFAVATVPVPGRSEARDLAVWRLSPVAQAAATVAAGASVLSLDDAAHGELDDPVLWERAVALAPEWAGTFDELLWCAAAL